MTKADKSRVKLLEKVSRVYGGFGMSNWVMALMGVAILIIDACLLIASAEEDELYMILPFHTFFATFFLGFMSYIATSLVGDMNSLYGKNNMNLVVNGSMRTGDFLGILPFEAKDMLRLRVKHFEKQLFTAFLTTIIVLIIAVLANNAGYTMHYGLGGAAVIAFILYELIMMSTLFMKRAVSVMLTTAAAAFFPMATMMGFASFADDHEKSAEIAGAIEVLGFLSEVPGIIFLAVCGVAIAFAAKKIADNKQNVSWNLR